MTFTVEVQPSGHTFEIDEGENILDAGLRHGLAMPYGCRGGSCGSCKGKIVSGEVDYVGGGLPIGLSEADEMVGMGLFCQALPKTDLVIEIKEIGAAKDIVVKTLPCRVAKMEKLAPDVMRLFLKLPLVERLQYLAGQYIDILLRDGKRRGFSIANPPHDDELLELHVRLVEGGQFTHFVFNEMKEKALLRFEGPLGNFYLREDSERPVILMAGGTGFAPMKAIIEHAFAEETQRPIHLYWGVRDKTSLYMADLAQEWADSHDNFSFTPVLSEPKPEDQWQARTGYVHEAILQDFSDLSGFDIYASGPPVMVDAGRLAFAERGMPNDNYFSDAFNFANDY